MKHHGPLLSSPRSNNTKQERKTDDKVSSYYYKTPISWSYHLVNIVEILHCSIKSFISYLQMLKAYFSLILWITFDGPMRGLIHWSTGFNTILCNLTFRGIRICLTLLFAFCLIQVCVYLHSPIKYLYDENFLSSLGKLVLDTLHISILIYNI